MSWNHRVMVELYKDEVYYSIHEVYYDENGIPNGYTADPIKITGDSLKGLKWTTNRISESIKKPAIWKDDKFPKELEITYSCDCCGRNKFTRPQPHKCLGGFRKRKLKFTENYN